MPEFGFFGFFFQVEKKNSTFFFFSGWQSQYLNYYQNLLQNLSKYETTATIVPIFSNATLFRTAVNTIVEIPAMSQIPSGVFLDFSLDCWGR